MGPDVLSAVDPFPHVLVAGRFAHRVQSELDQGDLLGGRVSRAGAVSDLSTIHTAPQAPRNFVILSYILLPIKTGTLSSRIGEDILQTLQDRIAEIPSL